MPEPAERIAALEQSHADLREDVRELREALRSDHHRLRDVEAASALMLEASKESRRAEENRSRRLELRVQWLTIVVGVAAVVSPLVAAGVHP